MSIQYLLNGLSGGKFFKYQFDRDTRAGDDRFAHHYIGVSSYEIGVHRRLLYHRSSFLSDAAFAGARQIRRWTTEHC